MKNVSSIIFLAVQLLLFCSSIYSFTEALKVNLSTESSKTPRERFRMMRTGGKSIYSGFVDAGRNFMIYDLDEIPPEIQIITVAFAGRYSPCENVGCGDLDKIFMYRGQKDKQLYLNVVNKLRQKNPNIIILFEVNDKILYNERITEAFQNMDKLVNFIEEFKFDGLNFRINPFLLRQKKDEMDDHLNFYYEYLKEFTNKMKDDKLLALTLNITGALCNRDKIDKSKINIVKDALKCRPCLVINYADTYCNNDLQATSAEPITGAAIPLLTKLKNKVDMVVVFEDLPYLPSVDAPLLVDFYRSYLNFADAYGFAVHVGFDVENNRMPLTEEHTPLLEKLSAEMKKENKSFKRGDGFSILNLGFSNLSFDEKELIKRLKKMLP